MENVLNELQVREKIIQDVNTKVNIYQDCINTIGI